MILTKEKERGENIIQGVVMGNYQSLFGVKMASSKVPNICTLLKKLNKSFPLSVIMLCS